MYRPSPSWQYARAFSTCRAAAPAKPPGPPCGRPGGASIPHCSDTAPPALSTPAFCLFRAPRRWPPLHSTKVWEVQMLLRRSGSCQSKQFCLEILRGIKPLRTKHLWSACSLFSAHKGLPAKTRRIHGSVGVFLFSVLRCALAPPPFGKWRFSPPRRR